MPPAYKDQGNSKNQKLCSREALRMPKKLLGDLPSRWCVKYVLNDLLTITEEGPQRSRENRSVIISSEGCGARAGGYFRFEEIPCRTSCGWFPVGGWGFPVGEWGHVTGFSQSEARDGAEFQDGGPHLHI